MLYYSESLNHRSFDGSQKSENEEDASTGTIIQKTYIDAPPEKVYNAFVDPQIHSEFTGSRATGAPKVGAMITSWNGYITGRNMKLPLLTMTHSKLPSTQMKRYASGWKDYYWKPLKEYLEN